MAIGDRPYNFEPHSKKEDDAYSLSPNNHIIQMTHHLIGTSAHAPQHPMVTYNEMATVGLGSHGLLRH
ncbi:hypothetical protein TNCV_5104951 [Trichonephila clavipes]|nr:hypothetical protein TNCV_5104951 [Trichonephila clavipes]